MGDIIIVLLVFWVVGKLLNQSFLTVFIPSLGWPIYHL